MIKNLLLSMCTVLLLAWNSYAQDRAITGRVVGDDGSPLPGVSVSVKGTTKGTSTSNDGNYKISVPNGAKLRFGFVGYTSQEISVSTQTVINVTLKSEESELSEVVVTGYGGSVKKREATGATSRVSGEQIENLPLQSFDKAIQGRSAGVQVSSANGVPGGAVQVRIRGIGSISAGNEPLYIVDGVQLNNRNDGGGTVSNNPLAFLNPNDIESIDILKDPATAAIYGAQAANGVVLITTKKGKASNKTTINFNYYKGIVDPLPTLRNLNSQEYIAARIEAVQNSNPTLTSAAVKTSVLTALGLTGKSDAELASLPTYDWQKEAYKQGTIDNYELSMQGGNDRTTFYTSLSVNKQDASLINIDFSKIGGKLSLTQKITSKITADAGINVSSITQRGPYGSADGTTAFGAPQYSAPIILPFNPIYNTDGSYFGLPASGINIIGDLSQNVIANSAYTKAKGVTNQLVGNLGLTYNPSKKVIVRGLVGVDYRNLKGSFFGDPRSSDYFNIKGSISESTNENVNISSNVSATYSTTIAAKHNISVMGGAEYRSEVNEGVSFSGQGFATPELSTANAAATPNSIGGFWTSVVRSGLFSNIRYDFDKKYLLNFIIRYDGSSRFGENNRWGVFPSISAKWNIAEEDFLKSSSVVSDLGLRVSFGSTGNDQISNFASRSLFGIGGVYQSNAGIGPSQLGNPNLRWERNVTLNLGLDFGFYNGRIKGSTNVYRRTSQDLLLTRSLPAINGFTSIFENIGEVENTGFEFEISTINVDAGDFKWETSFNFSAQKNEVTKLFEGVSVLPGNLSIRVGYPLFTNVGVPYAGVNPANGRPMWYDINDNLTYIVSAANNRPLGSSNIPKQFGGLTNIFKYKGLELSIFFQYEFGRTAVNTQEFRLADNGAVLRNSLKYYYDNRWTTPGQVTDIPKPVDNRTEISGRISSYQQTNRFYQDASYIRLKTATLSYNLPTTFLKKIKLTNARVYVQGVNLVTWTKWTGFDPEFVDVNGNNNQGIVPQSRNYTFGVQIGI
jgi:TonB-dependent starch-binding outer membrane protein SusC